MHYMLIMQWIPLQEGKGVKASQVGEKHMGDRDIHASIWLGFMFIDKLTLISRCLFSYISWSDQEYSKIVYFKILNGSLQWTTMLEGKKIIAQDLISSTEGVVTNTSHPEVIENEAETFNCRRL